MFYSLRDAGLRAYHLRPAQLGDLPHRLDDALIDGAQLVQHLGERTTRNRRQRSAAAFDHRSRLRYQPGSRWRKVHAVLARQSLQLIAQLRALADQALVHEAHGKGLGLGREIARGHC